MFRLYNCFLCIRAHLFISICLCTSRCALMLNVCVWRDVAWECSRLDSSRLVSFISCHSAWKSKVKSPECFLQRVFRSVKKSSSRQNACMGVNNTLCFETATCFGQSDITFSNNVMRILKKIVKHDNSLYYISFVSYTVTFFLPGINRPGNGVYHPPLSSAEVKESVELYLNSLSGSP